MRKKTFLRYFGILSVTFTIMFVVAVFSFIEMVFGNNKTTSEDVFSENIDFTVVIDPGHGGEDGGAVGSAYGTLEKDINLAISRDLYSFLMLTDISAVMTRTEDVMLYKMGQEKSKKSHDIRNRVQFIREQTNPLLVSIHQNKFPTEKYSGLQVYYSKNTPESKVFADMIQNRVVSEIQKENNRKIKKAGRNIYLLNNLDCPAVLVECGFLSNKNEEELLNNDGYRKQLAFVIFSCIADYAVEDV